MRVYLHLKLIWKVTEVLAKQNQIFQLNKKSQWDKGEFKPPFSFLCLRMISLISNFINLFIYMCVRACVRVCVLSIHACTVVREDNHGSQKSSNPLELELQ